MLGGKHPAAMGMALRDCGRRSGTRSGRCSTGVVESAQATWPEDQPLLLGRSGFLEEAYFTYSFSPIRGDAGEVDGVFTAVHETSERVLGEAAAGALAALGEALAGRADRAGGRASGDRALARRPRTSRPRRCT